MYFLKNSKKSIFKKNKNMCFLKKFKRIKRILQKWKEKSVSAELPLN